MTWRVRSVYERPTKGGNGSTGAVNGGTVKARWPGTCPVCGCPIVKGMEVSPTTAGRYGHTKCPPRAERAVLRARATTT